MPQPLKSTEQFHRVLQVYLSDSLLDRSNLVAWGESQHHDRVVPLDNGVLLNAQTYNVIIN